MIRILATTLLAVLTVSAQQSAENQLSLTLLPQEYWWGGATTFGKKMPFGQKAFSSNLKGDNHGNQYAPVLISSKGRYVWCDQAFSFSFQDGTLKVTAAGQKISYGKPANDLRGAFRYASKTFFPPSGKTPDLTLISAPQYNTWIELMYDQNQQDILKYAHDILANGMPPGVLMIDDNWQEDYGKWNFHPGRFSNPKAMMDELHRLGFKVMLWVCPFVSADCDVYRALAKKKAFFRGGDNSPAMVSWWNGKSAMLDLSNPVAMSWFTETLAGLQTKFGVDGYKLDAGDAIYYKPEYRAQLPLSMDDHTALFAKVGLSFPLNEYRACWKMAGQPLVQRLRDKNHKWSDVQQLIPDLIAVGLLGHPFVCPDMIGGGEFSSFLNTKVLDQEIIVRSAQIHALCPMMQFSVAPWRVLDKKHLAAVNKAVQIRMQYAQKFVQLAKESAKTGEPFLRPLCYAYPENGYEQIKDQFLMGEDLLVAPQTEKATSRTVQVPPGKWLSDDGTMVTGPATITVQTPLDRIPHFVRQ